jgi:acetyl-CoA acetyltransferase
MSEGKIVGVGITDFGRFPELTEEAMARVALVAAVEDAGLQIDDIQAFYCGNGLGAYLPGQRTLRGLAHGGEAVYNVENACSSGATALHLAVQALKAGQYHTVAVFGMDQLSGMSGPLALNNADWNVRRGMIMPALYAMRAARYVHDYDVPLSALADVSVKNRMHGSLNPIAKFCKTATREEVLASRPVAEPLTLLQCCPAVVDGAAALVLSTRACESAHGRPVRIAASQVQSGKLEMGHVDMTEAEITSRTAQKAYAEAGIGPEDLSVIELHDAFTISELLYYEALGLCGRGEAPALLDSGATRLGGRVPVNPSGGLLAKGHPPGATGVAQIVELCEQLQGRAGKRQVANARIGLSQVTGGGIWGVDHAACSIHILQA